MENEINEVQRVINTLNTVKVEGEANWDALSACIKHLRLVRDNLVKKNKELNEVTVEDVEVVPDTEE